MWGRREEFLLEFFLIYGKILIGYGVSTYCGIYKAIIVPVAETYSCVRRQNTNDLIGYWGKSNINRSLSL
jgi:hypothetical protein